MRSDSRYHDSFDKPGIVILFQTLKCISRTDASKHNVAYLHKSFIIVCYRNLYLR